MPTLLLPPRITPDSEALQHAAVSLPPAIVEANAAWGSGIYGCEPEQVLAVLRRATRKEETVTPEERGWLRPLPEVER